MRRTDSNLWDSKLALLASIPLGLSPYYLENLAYKFDAPFMALSVLASIFPFLFLGRKKLFILISFISLFIMLTSYQASSGIYIIICIFLALRELLNARAKNALNIALMGILSYGLCGILFGIFYEPMTVYANSQTLPLKFLPIGIYRHTVQYLNVIFCDFTSGKSIAFFALILGLCVIFIAKIISEARIHKILAFFLAIAALFGMITLSFGAYLVIINPTFYPRSMIGFGALVAILSIFAINFKTKFLRAMSFVIILALVEYLLMFSNFFAQALNEQGKYQHFRATLLASDFENILDSSHKNINGNFNIRIIGDAGLTPYVRYYSKEYPLISRLLPNTQREWGHSVVALQFFGIDANYLDEICPLSHPFNANNLRNILNAHGTEILNIKDNVEGAEFDVKRLKDSYYHQIWRYESAQDSCFVVVYKKP